MVLCCILKLLALSLCLEVFSSPGAHILSGNVFDPRSLNELFPDWKTKDVRRRVVCIKFACIAYFHMHLLILSNGDVGGLCAIVYFWF